jgi:hypothetical protein
MVRLKGKTSMTLMRQTHLDLKQVQVDMLQAGYKVPALDLVLRYLIRFWYANSPKSPRFARRPPPRRPADTGAPVPGEQP